MGLDISVYAEVVQVPPSQVPTDEHGDVDFDACYEEGIYQAFVYVGMEQSYRGLPPGEEFSFRPGGSKFYGGPWVRSVGESWGFHGGSYGGYNRFRYALSQMALGVDPSVVWANPDAFRDEPFFELVMFADNEGTIGGEAAADLAKDFEGFQGKATALWSSGSDEDEYYLGKYYDWLRACRDAAGSGMIRFH